MRNKIKKFICSIMCLLIVLSSVSVITAATEGSAAAPENVTPEESVTDVPQTDVSDGADDTTQVEVVEKYTTDYPEGVTAEEVSVAMEATEALLGKYVPMFTGKTLAENVKPMLYTDEALSSMLVSVYKGFNEFDFENMTPQLPEDESAKLELMQSIINELGIENVVPEDEIKDSVSSIFSSVFDGFVEAGTGEDKDLSSRLEDIIQGFNDAGVEVENLSLLIDSLVEQYNGFDMEEMGSFTIDTSVDAVAQGLADYPEVQQALINAGTWENVNLEGVSWGVTDKEGFGTAMGKSLTPLNDMLFMLLCSGTYEFSEYVKFEGADGYNNVVVPMLRELKCTNILTQEEYTAQAEADRSNMMKNIIVPIFSVIEEAMNTPINSLPDILPSISAFLLSGEIDKGMKTLMEPFEKNEFIEMAVSLGIIEFEPFEFDVTGMLKGELSKMTTGSDFAMEPLPLERLSTCGSHNGTEYVSEKEKAFIVIMRWLIDTLKLNKDQLPGLMQGMDMAKNSTSLAIPPEMITGLFEKDTDLLIGTLVHLFIPSETDPAEGMVYPEITKTVVQYTPNLTVDNYNKVLNEIDDLLDDFVKEGGQYSKIETVLTTSIYTNDNISSLFTGIYSALEKQEVLQLLELFKIDASPKGVAQYVKNYPAVYRALLKAESWSTVSLKGVSWGFKNGSRRDFQNALNAVLRPLHPVLRFLLAGEDIVLEDYITITGGDGYNTTVIPILEALGCDSKSIKTYSQYEEEALGDGITNNITEPIFDLLDEVFEKPVQELTDHLPNIVYFMNSGSLDKCISNLLIPVTSFAKKISPIYDIGFDTSSLSANIDINSLLPSMLKDSKIKIAEFDINSLAGIGTKTERVSKSMINGEYVKYSYIEADQTGVLMTFLRVLARTLKLPGNENLLVGSMAGGNATFATYSSSIGEQFAQMTEDELIEWLYNLLFKERVMIEIVVDETNDYAPTIIYKEAPKDYTWAYYVGGFLGMVLLVGIILFFNRKRLYY